MKISRERKVYLAILSIGGAVLGADQFLGGPASVNASVSPSPASESENAKTTTGVKAVARAVERIPLHEQLDRLASVLNPESAGDAFSIDPGWRAELTPNVPVDEATGAPTATATAPVHIPKVTMIVEDSRGGFAVLDGQPVRVGQEGPSGVRLVSMTKGVVVIESGGIEHTIKVNDSKPHADDR